MSGKDGPDGSGGRVSLDEVERIARLSLLRSDRDEMERLLKDLNTILEHVDSLTKIEVPSDEVGGSSVDGPCVRDEEVEPDPLERPAEQIAPEWQDGFFIVPRLPAVDADEGGGP